MGLGSSCFAPDRALALVTALSVASSGPLSAQRKGGEDVTGPYDVVEGWLKPLPWHQGWTFGLIAAVFPETPDRIFVLQGGELPDPRPRDRAPGARSNSDHRPTNFVLVLNREGELLESWSQWDSLFVRPHKITVNPYDPERHVWVVDDWASQVFKFTADGSRLVMIMGEKEVMASDRSHFGRPTDIVFLPDGSFLVSDGYVNTRVVKFDANGRYLMEWGSAGSAGGQFNLPHSVKVDANGRVYVADRRNGRIQIFDANGSLLDIWGDIIEPSHLVVAQDQTVWMSDPALNRLVQYDRNGTLLTYWGASGSFPGAFNNPHHFTADSEGNLYVADYANFRVQKFAPRADADRQRLVGPSFVAPLRR
jgi:sugar lactone lactonase YvrE